jgi:hypothetical protein
MVTLTRIVALVLLVGCLLAAGAWYVADRQATGFVQGKLEELRLSDLLAVERVRLPAPDVVRLGGVSLVDEVSGVEVAHLERLDVHLALPGRPQFISGEGGRALFTADGEHLVFARAIEAALDRLQERPAEAPVPPEDTDEQRPWLPPMEFRDIAATLRLPGLSEVTLPGCTAFLHVTPDALLVDIDAGLDGGHVGLEFGQEGLRRITTRDLAVTPVFALFLPVERELLADEVRPEGRLDLDVRLAHAGEHVEVAAGGVLRDATLRPARVPFPLTGVTLPFALERDVFRVREARATFEGGSLVASFEHAPEALTWRADVVDAGFRRAYLDLLPDHLDTSWLEVEDGGNLELHLRVEPDGLRGWGGMLVQHVRIGPTLVPVEDMIGRFDVRGSVLTLEEASGHCAGGVVSVRGSVDVESGEIDAAASVYDLDVARARAALVPVHRPLPPLDGADAGPGAASPGAGGPVADGAGAAAAAAGDPDAVPEEARGISGWLQGSLVFQGRLDDPRLARGGGQFSVRGGNLWRVPMLDAILQALQLVRPDEAERHRLTVLFDIAGRRYDIRMLKLESPFLSLVGDGQLNRDGTLEIDIVPIKVPLGYVGDLIEYIQSQLVRLEVRGTLRAPEVKVVPVKVVGRYAGRFWDWLGGVFSSEPEPTGPPFPPPEPP